jgi:hypothetical protein
MVESSTFGREIVEYILHGRCYDRIDGVLMMVDHVTQHADLAAAKAEVKRLFSIRADNNPDFNPALSARLWIESTDKTVFMRHDLFMGQTFKFED